MIPKHQNKAGLAKNSQKIHCTEKERICTLEKGSQNGQGEEK